MGEEGRVNRGESPSSFSVPARSSESCFADLVSYSNTVLDALSDALGLVCRLAAPGAPPPITASHSHGFCSSFQRWGAGACRRFHAEARGSADGASKLTQCVCPAGFTHLLLPVAADGEQAVALLEAGHIFDSKPDLERFGIFLRQARVPRQELDRLERRYLETPVFDERRLGRAKQVLAFAAEGLGSKAEELARRSSSRSLDPLTRAKLFIRDNLASPLDRGSVAARAGISEDHLTRLLRREGLSFSEWVNGARIRRAKRLLAEPGLRISEIAFSCGYESIPHFNRQFRKITGLSPTAFRAQTPPENGALASQA